MIFIRIVLRTHKLTQFWMESVPDDIAPFVVQDAL